MGAVSGRRSAGVLLYRRGGGQLEVLLGHMGGPFWARRDVGAWTIPKGEPNDGEDALAAAYREFSEELGVPVPAGPHVPLGTVRQRGGKTVDAWAVHGDLDPATVTPGTFELEWPPGSARLVRFPELDRVEWMTVERARSLIVRGQRDFLDRLEDLVVDQD